MSDWELVTPAGLRAELERLGFTAIEREGKAGETWALLDDLGNQSDESPAVLVPREGQQEIRGYTETLRSAVERLSWILGLSEERTIDYLTKRGDRFELRIVDEGTAGGRLPLLRAPDVVTGFLRVIRGGARAQFRGTRASYQGPDPEDVSEALGGIDLLAPSPGSFRLTAISSEQAQLPLDRLTAEPDKSRLTLAASLRAIYAAAETADRDVPEDSDELLNAVDRGMSSTVLKGLAEIAGETGRSALEFVVRWDPALPIVDAPVSSVVLSEAQLSRVPKIIEQLRHHAPQENERVWGWVKTVTANALAEEGKPAGFVIIEIKREGRSRDVRIELPPEVFAQAKAGASLLRATGTLERISARWHLINPSEISITDSVS